ncbi:uncharacterized protein RHOBADRAFT_55261 [Rhodotorula graminis WP1]|uniref:Uncharacterized protein n=1 Tax=Rhodotorula graminis (strain WP1) TaxID=578459 RepID=A0A0P9F0Q0_RHOGW|nr:uncharacterized protein RHOBADRAFT_55261 [Rhodotorula graminis WP1]KPV73020.1 hypothetical protein RHOBADRAFT_55261 [Rhodotorula graminis WP1]
MSSSRLLTQLDMPSARAPSSESSPSSDDSCPATPSKDKFREWTFPRQPSSLAQSSPPSSASGTAGAANTASSPAHAQQQRMHNLVDGAHGRSSSVTPSKGRAANKGSRAAADSMDLRHRSNASLAQSPSSPLLARTLLSPARPKEVAKLVYSNVRRKSLNDLTYVVLFAACLVLFGRALLGVGYDPRSATPRTSPAAVRAASPEPASVPAAVVDVQLPEGFLPHAAAPAPPSNPDEYLADVHQAHGDSSHDAGEDHFRASPDDPALSDEHVHAHHSSEDPLWPEDPTHLDREAEAAARPRPRPARLAPQDDAPAPAAAPAQDDIDAEEARLVELVGAGDETSEAGQDEVEGEELDVVYEGDEVPGGEDEQVVVVEDGESNDVEDDEDDEVVDDEPAAAAAPGSLHVVDADDDDASPGALSALEELLDSAQEEELAARVKKGGDAEAAQREVLRRAQRGREALARAQAKAAPGAGAGVERRRMVRAKKVRR